MLTECGEVKKTNVVDFRTIKIEPAEVNEPTEGDKSILGNGSTR